MRWHVKRRGAFLADPHRWKKLRCHANRWPSNTTAEIGVHIHLPDGRTFNGGSPFEYGVIADPKIFRETINHIQSLAAPRTASSRRRPATFANGEIGLELRYFIVREVGTACACCDRSISHPGADFSGWKNRITVDDRPQ